MSATLPAGAFDARIGLSRPSANLDELGAPAGFEPAGFAWARLEPLGAASAEEPFTGQGRARLRVQMRAPHALAAGWRMIIGTRIFRVQTISAPTGRGGIVEADCIEEAP